LCGEEWTKNAPQARFAQACRRGGKRGDYNKELRRVGCLRPEILGTSWGLPVGECSSKRGKERSSSKKKPRGAQEGRGRVALVRGKGKE